MREFLTEAEIAAFTSHENPMTRAQKAMLTPMPKRFYKDVSVGEAEGQFQVLLDGKPVRTPAKAYLQFPTRAAAELVAAEFSAQEKEINPAFMPVTRLANTVIDGVINELDAVRDEVSRYAGNDMLCYRAESPDALVMRQVEQWDPYLEWFRTRHGVRFYLTEGVIHVEQPKEALEQARIAISSITNPWVVAVLHTFTTLTGSAVLALAAVEGHASAADAWNTAHLEEDWTNDQWGADFEAEARRANRWIDMDAADRLLKSIQ